jgi:hypothetical protein
MTVYFPFHKDLELRSQYQLLNLNSLRVGKIMSIVDSLCSDACYNFISDDQKAQRESFFLTAMMDGLTYQSRFKADQDMGITVYSVSQKSSHLAIRADIVQKRSPGVFEPVFSSNFYLACRNKKEKSKFNLPDIDYTGSDSEDLAKQRSLLAEDMLKLVNDVNPLNVYSRPPTQTEF